MDTQATRICGFVRKRIDEYVDGALGKTDAAAVSDHVAACASCSRLLAQARETRDLVRALGQRTVPASFDAALARRIGEIDRRGAAYRWATFMGLVGSAGAQSLLRSGLAAATIVVIVLGGVSARQSASVAPQGREAALVSRCVAQHQTYVSGEPVSDWSAQNLVGHVNGLDPDGTDDSL
jgi:anti-sigma factor RsiW